jgi:hypothetical protein
MRDHIKMMQLRGLAHSGLGLTFLDTYTNGRDYGQQDNHADDPGLPVHGQPE